MINKSYTVSNMILISFCSILVSDGSEITNRVELSTSVQSKNTQNSNSSRSSGTDDKINK